MPRSLEHVEGSRTTLRYKPSCQCSPSSHLLNCVLERVLCSQLLALNFNYVLPLCLTAKAEPVAGMDPMQMLNEELF